MDFADHEDVDEEMASPTASSYDAPAKNLSRVTFNSGGPGPETASLAGGANRSVGSGAGSCRYRECLKNHAVGMGGHAVDGCGEFMPAGADGTLDALRCAACSCHRNFHRKEADGNGGGVIVPFEAPVYYPPYYRTPSGYLHHNHHMAAAAAAAAHHHHRPVAPLAQPSTSGGTSRDEQDDISNPVMAMAGGFMMSGVGASGSGKKRFRTKFTQEQKDKMLAFAERVGWRIQKHDEAAVQQFCEEACVRRHVLKVWMHNNKHTLGKKPSPPA